MNTSKYSYMLRILRHDPYQETLERMAEYFRILSELLGKDNKPMFAGVVKKSVGVRARIPEEFVERARARITAAANDGTFLVADRQLAKVGVQSAQLLDSSGNICHKFMPKKEPTTNDPRLVQHGTVDGVITGLVGADDTMHLYVHDAFGRKLTLIVRDIQLAKELLQHFRTSEVRLQIEGVWRRTEDGWAPEPNRCTVKAFDILDEHPIAGVFDTLRSIPDNGWGSMDDPYEFWERLRGIEH